MKDRQKDRRLFQRYLLSYLLLLCLPMAVLGMVVQQYFLKSHEESILREKTMQIAQTQTALEAQIKPLQNFATMISMDNRFSLYAIENNPTAYIDILQELRYIMHITPGLHEVLYHPLGTEQYFQSSGTVSRRFLFSGIMHYEELDSDNSEAFFSELRAPAWLKTQTAYGGEPVYTYVHPLPMNQSVVLFQIQARALDVLFSDPETLYFLSDTTGRIFHAPHSLLADYADMSLPEAGIIQPYTWRNQAYYAYRTPVGDGAFAITVLIPRTQITRATQAFARSYYIILAALVLLGVGVVVLLLRVNYRPIQRLGSAARALDRSIPEHMDSLESAYHAIHSLANEPPLKDADRDAMREACLFRLLRGQYESLEAFNTDGERLGLFLSGSCFRVIILSGAYESEDAMPSPALFEQMYRLLSVEFEAFLLEYVEQFRYILILSADPGQETALAQRLAMLQAHYQETAQGALTIGVGEVYPTPASILLSYNEAKEAIQYRLTRATGSIYWYRELRQAHPPMPAYYPNEELNALSMAIVNGQAAKVEFILQLLLEMCRQDFKSLFLAVCLCYDILNTMLRALREIHCTPPDMEEYIALYERRALGSVEQLLEVIERLGSQVVGQLSAEQARAGTLDMRAVLDAIAEQKADPNFSVGSLADQFNLSISNFSHQFKGNLGVNVSTYINDLRIEEARLLLLSTELSVSDIAAKIGYLQPSSFIRKFKQITGLTPGEYRQQRDANH